MAKFWQSEGVNAADGITMYVEHWPEVINSILLEWDAADQESLWMEPHQARALAAQLIAAADHAEGKE